MKQWSRSLCLSFLTFASVGLGACSSGKVVSSGLGAVPAPRGASVVRSTKARLAVSDVPEPDVAALVASNGRFAVDLYKAASKGDQDFVFSPSSLSAALLMSSAGARGETATEMASAMRTRLSAERLHAAANAIDSSLHSLGVVPGEAGTSPFTLNVVNQLWGKSGFAFESAFLDTLAENYGAGVYTLNFAGEPEASRAILNRWVSDNTGHMIAQLFPPNSIKNTTHLVIANATYFKALWAVPFVAAGEADFTRLDLATVQAPVMRQSAQFSYVDTGDMRIVTIPYYENKASMTIVVPEDFADFEAQLDSDSLLRRVDQAPLEYVSLTMPKFSIRSLLDAQETLKRLGMRLAFDEDQADFSGISTRQRIWIDDVLHQATIDVDETGTEATAATGVVFGGDASASEPPTPIEFRVDQPFFYFIRDKVTHSLLFVGRVVDPS